ncbi:MAG: hypothetical protein HYR74_13135 [Candidatus Eisenbacteria bacterium]|nr:hypothetical protein [Candidatus Eisenbacteria bacterium]
MRCADRRRPGPPAPDPPRRDAPLRHPAFVAAALVAAACVAISVSFALYDADQWQNLAFGRAIWRLHDVPRTQLFAWPNYGALLVNPSWGFTALVWPLWQWGGVPGLFVWRWATTLAAFALLWAAARRMGARGFAALPVLVLCALVYRQRSQIRPETLAAVWFALAVWLLESARHGGRDRRWWLVAVMIAWVNTHVSFYLAPLLVGIHRLDAWRGRRPDARVLDRVGVAMLAAGFLNPYGWRTLVRPFQFAFAWRNEPIFRVISEIRTVDWSVNWANGLPLLVLAWPLLLAWRWRRAGLDRVELAMMIVFTALGLASGRFIGTYALAAAPYVARDLAAWLEAWRAPALALRSLWARAALTGCLSVGACLYEWRHFEGPIAIAFDMRQTPERACRFMAEHGIRGRGFNHFYVAGTMLWRFWPERDRLPFMTGSPEDSPRELRAGYLAALQSAEGWRALDAQYHFDYALVSRRYLAGYGLIDLLDEDPGWARVFVDDVAAVYVRRDGPLAPVAAADGYRLLPGGRAHLDALLRRAVADSTVHAVLEVELDRQAREAQSNFYGRALRRSLEAAARGPR